MDTVSVRDKDKSSTTLSPCQDNTIRLSPSYACDDLSVQHTHIYIHVMWYTEIITSERRKQANRFVLARDNAVDNFLCLLHWTPSISEILQLCESCMFWQLPMPGAWIYRLNLWIIRSLFIEYTIFLPHIVTCITLGTASAYNTGKLGIDYNRIDIWEIAIVQVYKVFSCVVDINRAIFVNL